MEIINKLKKANLFGKGGAGFSTSDKWQAVKEAEGDKKYIIVNSSEGELGAFKDLYILRNHMDKVFKGIDYAINFLACPVEVYFHINKFYFNELQSKIYYYINNHRWEDVVFHINIEEPCYIGGEASALMNIIETGIAQPKPRIHRTVVKGLFEKPTMMNNVETFYDVARILDGDYDDCRFVGIWGDGIDGKIVVRSKIDASLDDILQENNLKPNFDCYVQVGGSASGIVYNNTQLKDNKINGIGAIEIFDKSKRNTLYFLKRLIAFYAKEGCGKCMGKKFATELNEKIQSITSPKDIKIEELMPLINDMNKKTFCKLCKSLKTPVVSYYANVLNINLE